MRISDWSSDVCSSDLDLAHAVGAKLLLDGCQAAPRMKLDMAALDCDFYVFSAHKLYGPTGIGVLWARPDILDGMPPWQGGGAVKIGRASGRGRVGPQVYGSVVGGSLKKKHKTCIK